MHSNMEEEDFRSLVNDLRNKKIISPALWKEYKNTD